MLADAAFAAESLLRGEPDFADFAYLKRGCCCGLDLIRRQSRVSAGWIGPRSKKALSDYKRQRIPEAYGVICPQSAASTKKVAISYRCAYPGGRNGNPERTVLPGGV